MTVWCGVCLLLWGDCREPHPGDMNMAESPQQTLRVSWVSQAVGEAESLAKKPDASLKQQQLESVVARLLSSPVVSH